MFRYTCPDDDTIFNDNKFSNLSKTVEIPIISSKDTNINLLINNYLKEEELKGEELPKFCDGEKLCKTAYKQLRFYNTSSYLIILLKRTNFDIKRKIP